MRCSPAAATTCAAIPARSRFPAAGTSPSDADLVRRRCVRPRRRSAWQPRRSRSPARLRPTPTIATGYAIYPFVGVIEPGLRWTLEPRRGGVGARAVARRPAGRIRPPAAASAWAADPHRHVRRRRRADLGRDRADPPGPARAPALSRSLPLSGQQRPLDRVGRRRRPCTGGSGSAVSSTYGISDRSQAPATTPPPAASTAGRPFPPPRRRRRARSCRASSPAASRAASCAVRAAAASVRSPTRAARTARRRDRARGVIVATRSGSPTNGSAPAACSSATRAGHGSWRVPRGRAYAAPRSARGRGNRSR